MTDEKIDRRIQRTRQLLLDAFMELILEQGYNATTIRDITDRANVGRSTFYVHYRDKEELLSNYLNQLYEAFEEHIKLVLESTAGDESNPSFRTNLPLIVLKYVEHEQRLFKALIGEKRSEMHFQYFRKYMVKYTRDIIKNIANKPLSAHESEIVVQYIVNTFLGWVVWWVNNDFLCSAEELYETAMRLIEPGLTNVLNVSTLWFSAHDRE